MKKNIGIVFTVLMIISVMVWSLSGCQVKSEEAAATEAAVSETSVVAGDAAAASVFIGDPNETYFMNTFLSGAEYWVGCFKGFKDAGDFFGVKTEYTGAAEYELAKQVASFEQIAAQKPMGIAVACLDGPGFADAVNKVLESGIPVVTFDSDSADSKRLSFLAVDNFNAGYVAGKKTIEDFKTGKIAMLARPGQESMVLRSTGFEKAISESNGAMEIVATADGGGDEAKAATAAASMIQSHPDIVAVFSVTGIESVGAATAVKESGKDIKVIAFDADKPVLDLIKEGTVAFTLYENTYSMGFWSMTMLYNVAHGILNPPTGWKEAGKSPLPPYVNTGINIIDKANADLFYN
jgi:ribose transport system substrate-binding protein